MGTKRSKALHNFTLPCGLRWGNQRLLRCMNVNSNGQISPADRFDASDSGSSDHRHQHHRIQQRRTARDGGNGSGLEFSGGSLKVNLTQPLGAVDGRGLIDGGVDNGIASTREKVMFDLQTAADKMKDAIFRDEHEDGKVPVPPQLLPQLPRPEVEPMEGNSNSNNNNTYRPWNLRSRRASCKVSVSGIIPGRYDSTGGTAGGGKCAVVDLHSGFSQIRVATAPTGQKPPIHRGNCSGTAADVEKSERPKFSVTLSKREIEEDFFAMVGHRPPRRPKKRARVVQKQLDTLFPGLWLTEVTPDMYRVSESGK